MFELENNMVFVNVDINYVKELYNACSEVYYTPLYNDQKPYIGILISSGKYKYILPLTSAKEKHKKWKNSDIDRMLVYEMVDYHVLSPDDIWVKIDETDIVKHIISAIDIKKMIPVKDEVLNIVDINHDEEDDEDTKKYKDLLNKEYSFCISIIDELISKAANIYDKQMETGVVKPFSCDFKILEQTADNYFKE